MSIAPIVEYPNPVLRQIAQPVDAFDNGTLDRVNQLIDTLNATTGIGLCAPQLGHSQQIMVMDLSETKNQPEVLINPQIKKKAGFAICEERCLSIPGIAAKVIRPSAILITAQNTYGDSIEREYNGMKAICVQHEIDHLQGKLFIDRVSRLRQLRFRGALRALEQNASKSKNTAATA